MKLTMPSYDVGAAKVMVDGRQVGHALGEFYGWRAYLWPVADQLPRVADEGLRQVHTRGRLRDLRVLLRLEQDGPWWTEQTEVGG